MPVRHYMIEWKKAIDWPNTDRLVFQGKRPNVQPNHDTATGHDGKAPRGPAWKQRQSLDAGHFYVYCNKIGTLKSGGNRLPCFDTPGGYVPRPEKTIDPWWMAGKLSDDVYEHYAAKLGRGCDQRLRDVAAKRKFFARDPPYETTHAPIPLSQLPPEVNIWHDQIDKKTDRKFALLLHGPSLTGKTHIARQFAPKAHMYMRSAIDWDHWRVAHATSKYVVFDDIDWSDPTKYSYDLCKALLSSPNVLRHCSSHAFMRPVPHGLPVIIIMNDQTAEEKALLQKWKTDPWFSVNLWFVEIKKPYW